MIEGLIIGCLIGAIIMFNWIVDTWWKFVFWWKQRTGFIKLFTVSVHGEVLSLASSDDGDALFNLQLDEEYLWTTPGIMGRIGSHGRLHCELPPWIRGYVRDVYKTLKPGDRVRVIGTLGFDGVHMLPRHWPWWAYPLEVLLALVRHQPNVKDGWWELHPVTLIEKLVEPEYKVTIETTKPVARFIRRPREITKPRKRK